MAGLRRAAAACASVSALLAAAPALAGGFYAPYQSSTANMTAIAGATAGTGDVSGLFFNPAANASISGHQVYVDAKAFFPQLEINVASANAPFVPGPTFGGADITGDGNSGSLADEAFAPNVFASLPINDRVKLGFAFSGPFAARLDANPTWAGRYHLTKTDIETINVTTSLAWQATPTLAIGVGVQVQYFDGVFEKAEIGPNPFAPGTFIDAGIGFLEGDDIEVGFTAGLVWQPTETTRIGLAYRSEMEHDFSGTAGLRINPLSHVSAHYDLTMPQIVSLGLHHAINDRWTLLGEVQWQDFSEFTGFDIALGGPPFRDIRPQNWDDSWIFALGFAYRHDERTILRAGAHYDTAVSDGGANTLSPDADRVMIGFGIERRVNDRFRWSAHYAHVFFDDAPINVTSPAQGSLVASMETDVDIFGISGTLTW